MTSSSSHGAPRPDRSYRYTAPKVLIPGPSASTLTTSGTPTAIRSPSTATDVPNADSAEGPRIA